MMDEFEELKELCGELVMRGILPPYTVRVKDERGSYVDVEITLEPQPELSGFPATVDMVLEMT
jgi:hypothetical protein